MEKERSHEELEKKRIEKRENTARKKKECKAAIINLIIDKMQQEVAGPLTNAYVIRLLEDLICDIGANSRLQPVENIMHYYNISVPSALNTLEEKDVSDAILSAMSKSNSSRNSI